ncbi:UNVERIFIED_CONTAM: hypothetical protein K2H54_077936 [Gekko kuhli]
MKHHAMEPQNTSSQQATHHRRLPKSGTAVADLQYVWASTHVLGIGSDDPPSQGVGGIYDYEWRHLDSLDCEAGVPWNELSQIHGIYDTGIVKDMCTVVFPTVTYHDIHKSTGMIDSVLQQDGEEVLASDEVFCLANWCMDRDVASIYYADALWKSHGSEGSHNQCSL